MLAQDITKLSLGHKIVDNMVSNVSVVKRVMVLRSKRGSKVELWRRLSINR
jgi:hypothetical protein